MMVFNKCYERDLDLGYITYSLYFKVFINSDEKFHPNLCLRDETCTNYLEIILVHQLFLSGRLWTRVENQ